MIGKHIINVKVANCPGVLARIVGLISGRGFNIETLNVGPTHDPAISKMTIVFPGENTVIDQIIEQLAKQINVYEVVNVTDHAHIDREVLLVKIATQATGRAPIIEIAMLFNAKVVGVQPDALTVQMVGDQMQVQQFLTLLQPYTIATLSRSGTIAVVQGSSGEA